MGDYDAEIAAAAAERRRCVNCGEILKRDPVLNLSAWISTEGELRGICPALSAPAGSPHVPGEAAAGDPVSVWQGELTMSGLTLHVHVLSDGSRIIEAADLEALIAAWARGVPVDEEEAAAFARWQRGTGTEVTATRGGGCWHLISLHGPNGCAGKVYPAHSLEGEPCPCEVRP